MKECFLYRYLAALLLFPASLKVYDTPRAWVKALAAGPTFFFAGVVRSAPGLVFPSSSRWRNLLMYWPMKAGIHLVRSRSIGATLRKARQRMLRGGPQPVETPAYHTAAPEACSAENVRRLLQDPGIEVVSFDIFDTLLERPVLRPRDIFHLVAAAVDSSLGVDFVRMRWNAEEETGLVNACLDDIYAHMQKKFGLDAATTAALRDEELRCEETLLAPRADMRACYEEAVRLGKRIIAVSDMYIPGDILLGILRRKGYDHIAAVYVSCDYGKRKSDGSLYAEVLKAENIPPSAMLHTGDNLESDCRRALACGITALFCPSPLIRRLEAEPALDALLDGIGRKDPFWGLLLGFALQRLCVGDSAPSRIGALPDVGSFAAVTIAPLLTGYCLSLAGDKTLRRDYTSIYFASRDGYLPRKVYDTVAGHVPNALPAVYFQAGRRAYYPFLYESFYDYAESLPPAANGDYSLRDFIGAHFGGSPLAAVLEAGFSDEEKELSFFAERARCLSLLRRFNGEIAAFMEEKRARARRYYESVFPSGARRHLVFDLGYSGSVGQALGAATHSIVDKLYFWGTPDNDRRDARLGSHTRLFMRTAEEAPYNLLLEELFSPCAGGVVDFDEDAQPVFEALEPDAVFREELDAMQDVCLDFAESFCRRCGTYAALVCPASGDAFVEMCRYLLVESPCCNGRLLRHIRFPDPLHHSGVPSLEYKMEHFLPQPSVFSGTGFADPRRRLTPAPIWSGTPRLGVHVHVHNPALLDEMSRYLRNFPQPLDVFVTLTDASCTEAARRLFGPACIERVRQTTVLVVPNRGRDVAPWILSMRPWQKDYDLFCHVHAKESAHFDFGTDWRRYLLQNLLQPEAVAGILALFAQRPELGCLFPPTFPPLAAFMSSHAIPPAGLCGELDSACALLRRMGFEGEICRSELFFSMGTMLWYRPDALRQLFTVDLALEEFAAEPIGVEGTIAHAVERLPALIAERNGYVAGTFPSRFC